MRLRSVTPESPKPTSPPSSTKKGSLSIYNIANIFIQMRHAREQAKAQYIESSSGDPQTHASVAEGTTCPTKIDIEHNDVFICSGAVNVTVLLRATRASLMETAELAGANVLIDEQWKCTISGPKNRPNGTFKVQIRYSAKATRSDKPEPHKPVALDQAKSVPGLMTILSRNE